MQTTVFPKAASDSENMQNDLKKVELERKEKCVLMIDDEPDMVEIVKKVLTRAGYQFLSANDGEKGLELLLKKRPDLVLLDWMMPGKSGHDVLHELAKSTKYRPVADTPVIMLTAKMEYQVDRKELFELGLSAFLIKPFGHRELINVIDNVFILDDLKKKNRELEKKLRQSEYKYQDLIENASDLIFTINKDGKFVFINRRLLALTGLRKTQILGKDLREIIIPEDQSTVWENFLRVIRGNPRIFEFRVLNKEKNLKYLSTNLNPIFDKGEVSGAVGISRDVSQQKKLEQQIVDLKNFNESIVESMGAGLITIDLKNRITSFNASAEEILGYKSENVIGNQIENILTKADVERLLPDESSIETNPMHRELQLNNGNGHALHIGFSVTPRIDNRNRRVGTIISFRDISQIKQMQAEVARMDRLASLGVLASGIAHEIRNPLAGIKTVAQTLEEEIPPQDGKQEYLARIIRQVNRMDDLLKAFFTYARPGQPVRKLSKLQEIINEVLPLVEQKMSSNGVSFEQSYAPDLPLIFVDFGQIHQVLLNLFLNAIDAMSGGGKLSINAEPLYSSIRRTDRRGQRFHVPEKQMLYVKIAISDTGEGINKEDLNEIFNPFFTTKPNGSGLGLSIVYRIIEEHKGDIFVESEPEVGTTFTLLLATEES
ncbi:PAS domain S-box protein [candidate division KSB1 bacterium]|nr:PAS domain S-box protein [candidate division KSB1 bacterium]